MNIEDKKKGKKFPFRVKFLIAVLLSYLIVACFNFGLSYEAFLNTVNLFIKLLPLFLFVFVLNFVMNKYLTAKIVQKHVGDKKGVVKYLYAIVLGVLISGPPYMLYPMLGDLKKRGASDGFLATLLFNRNVKIPFIPVMIYYFGLAYTLIISLLIIVFSLLNGYLVMVFAKGKATD